jgi:peptidoglycan-associated lipoprotein
MYSRKLGRMADKERKLLQVRKAVLFVAAILALLFTASCPKSVPPTPPPPPPAASSTDSKPTITFSATPRTISPGSASTLRWSVTNAATIRIDNGIGSVEPNGQREIRPTNNTMTYTLEATTSSGETASATETVTVSNPPAAVVFGPGEVPKDEAIKKAFETRVRDLHFTYSEEQIVSGDQPILENDALVFKSLLQRDPGLTVLIEGHCDERGSAEYNIALGDRRANFVKQSLIRLGIDAAKLQTVSLGKERPLCIEDTEQCFARNRRAHFSVAP